MSQLEVSKKEVEQKLSSVVSTLRRIAGIQLDGSVNMPFKLMSPSRRWSPVRGKFLSSNYYKGYFFNYLFAIFLFQDHGDSSREVVLDVDPEAVRKGVRSFMHQIAQIERERVSIK